MRLQTSALSAFILVLASSSVSFGETLVLRQADGSFKPGAASAWSEIDGGLSLTLTKGVKADDVAELLGDRLAQAKISVSGNTLKITGLSPKDLLEKLSGIDLTDEGDPLAELSGLDEGVAMAGPEGGGSIRASKPSKLVASLMSTPESAARVSADVLSVEAGDFPEVTLKLRVRNNARVGDHKKYLRKGRVIEGAVVMAEGKAGADFGAEVTQRNLAAYYLRRGDRVSVHASTQDGKSFVIDFVERTR